MNPSRRSFLRASALASVAPLARPAFRPEEEIPVIDTHQHLWDLETINPPWMRSATAVLRRRYETDQYRLATKGLNVKAAIYMEVDVDPADHVLEAERILTLIRSRESPTVAAVIGGRPASPDFQKYLDRWRDAPEIKGVRQVLHGDSNPPGQCLQPDFIKGIRSLARHQLSFDICLRPTELDDAAKLVQACPDTRFILDHCGNANPSAFLPNPPHDPDAWKRSIEKLAKLSNIHIKISGIVARAPKGWKPESLAPIVDHCLDTFGPNRVLFGGDWPVCLQGASFSEWLGALRHIVAPRPQELRQKLFHQNATDFYSLAP